MVLSRYIFVDKVDYKRSHIFVIKIIKIILIMKNRICLFTNGKSSGNM